MFHVNAASFAAATPIAPPTFPPLRPWEYLRLRREAAGLSIDDVATALSPRLATRSDAAALVRLLETPNMRAKQTRTLGRLAQIFPFDPGVYRQLVEEPADRHPAVCRGCGCSYWARISAGKRASVNWTPPHTCTACALDGEQTA